MLDHKRIRQEQATPDHERYQDIAEKSSRVIKERLQVRFYCHSLWRLF